MTQPLFNIGDTVYLKESAGIGILETTKISSIMRGADAQWVYTTTIEGRQQSLPTFGDRNHYTLAKVLYFNESELMAACEAYELVETVLTQRLNVIRAIRIAQCA